MLICQQMLMHYRAVTDAEDMTSAVSGEITNLLLLLYYHKKESFKDMYFNYRHISGKAY